MNLCETASEDTCKLVGGIMKDPCWPSNFGGKVLYHRRFPYAWYPPKGDCRYKRGRRV